MKITEDTNILIIGLGLLGGTYAKALSKKGYKVSAITKEQADIDYALCSGLIGYGTTEVSEELIKKSDLIIFALYPKVFISWVKEHGGKIKPGTLVTDVTGVKGKVVKKVQHMLPEGVEFIAAHPMAGREVSGVENADERIFEGANYIVVPTDKNTPEATEACKELGKILGFATISELSVDEHDEMIAYLSQLTHCIAVSLMCSSENPYIGKYTGDSFRDLTRIAKINEDMWTELFMMNKDKLLHEMNMFILQIMKMEDILTTGNTEDMKAMMRYAKNKRISFDKNMR